MSIVLVGLQCQLDSLSLFVSAVYPRPVFYVICPFTFILSLHYSEHHCLKFPVITHSGDMSKQARFPPYCVFLSTRRNSVSFVIFWVLFTLMILR